MSPSRPCGPSTTGLPGSSTSGGRAAVALALALAAAACAKRDADPVLESDAGAPVSLAPRGKVLEAAENEGAGPARKGPAQKAPAAAVGDQVEIPSGTFKAGSAPGDRGRDPVLEPAMLEVDLGGFSIDRSAYPNDPRKPPVTGVSRSRAADLCQQAGARLCTEIEWERACKGPDGDAYGGGAAWDPACAASPASCASGFGVLGLGASLREWTASDVSPVENVQAKAAAARGARGSAGDVDHRCAHRAALDPAATADDLGFRCCHGAPNAATIPAPAWQQTFRKAELSPGQAAEMFASVPQLKDLAGGIVYFKEPDDVNLVLRLGDAGGAPPNTTLTTAPLLWSPVPGEEILVVTGKAQKSSFVVAFYRLPGDRYRIASSFVMKDERGPVVLGFNGYVRRKLTWSTCWDCNGESGLVTYREDNRVVITQR